MTWRTISTPALSKLLDHTILADDGTLSSCLTQEKRDQIEFQFYAACIGRWLAPNMSDDWHIIPYHWGPAMTGKSLMFRAVLGPLCCLYHNQRDAVYQLDSSQLESFYSPDEFSLDRLHNQGRTRAWLCDDIDDISGLPFTLFCPMLGERVIHLRLGSPARVIEPKDFPPGQFASNVDPQGYISTKLGHTSLMRRIIPFHYARPIPQALANEIALALPEEMDSILQKGKLAYKEALAHNSFSS